MVELALLLRFRAFLTSGLSSESFINTPTVHIATEKVELGSRSRSILKCLDRGIPVDDSHYLIDGLIVSAPILFHVHDTLYTKFLSATRQIVSVGIATL